jgi:hypothetical protein
LTLLLTRKEKEEMVISLAKEGKTTRHIAEIVHISLKDIGKIIRKFTGDVRSESNKIEEEEEEKMRINKLSIYAQAFYLFREKKPLVDVVITLNLNTDIVLNYYKDYLRLMGMYKLVNLYHSLGKDLPLFLYLFDRVKKEGLTRDDVKDLIEIQRSVGEMENAVTWLNKHVPELVKEKEELEQEIVRLSEFRNSLENAEY